MQAGESQKQDRQRDTQDSNRSGKRRTIALLLTNINCVNPPGLDAVVTVQILSDLCSFLLSSCFSSILVAIVAVIMVILVLEPVGVCYTNPVRSTSVVNFNICFFIISTPFSQQSILSMCTLYGALCSC